MNISSIRRWGGILILPLFFLGLDVALDKHLDFLSWTRIQWGVWSVGWAWDLSAWLGFVLLLSWLRGMDRVWSRRLFLALAVFDSVALSAATILSAGYRAYFHHLPNVHALEFAIFEWKNTWTMLVDGWSAIAWIWVLVSVPGLVWFHFLSARWWTARWSTVLGWRLRLRFAPLVVLLAASPFALGWHRFQEPLPLLANWTRVFVQFGLGMVGNRTNLQSPTRVELPPPVRPRTHANVLLVLNESLRQDAFDPRPDLLSKLDARELAPHMAALEMDTFATVAFSRGRSNSSATSVSVPSLMTGVPPHGSTFEFHRAPTLFTAAKAAGYRTFLVSSQDWHWEHFDEFFFGGIDRIVHRGSFPVGRNNDLGVDDSLLLDSLPAVLATNRDRPFFGVVQLNSNHGPFWPGRTHQDLPLNSLDRYKESVRYVDRIIDRAFAELRKAGLWDSTLVVMVADHGENIGAREIGRINSFYDETIRIPYLVRLPADLRGGPVQQALSRWRDIDVQLLDIEPTLLDLWGFDPGATAVRGHGSSLLAPPDSTRVIGGQNTGDIRSWDQEGLYLVSGHWKFLLIQGREPGLYDLSRDPLEARNLWSDSAIRKAQMPWIAEAMRSSGRAAVCRRSPSLCPEPVRGGPSLAGSGI